jgi:hypothetical protein
MGERVITSCRGCRSKKLKSALRINGKEFVICQTCTLLQRQDDISYEITFDLSLGNISVDYYPYFLRTEFSKEEAIVYFSLKAIEVILEQGAYKVTDVQTTDDGKLNVQFERMNNLEKLRLFEMVKKLGSQFTYFLYSVKKK